MAAARHNAVIVSSNRHIFCVLLAVMQKQENKSAYLTPVVL